MIGGDARGGERSRGGAGLGVGRASGRVVGEGERGTGARRGWREGGGEVDRGGSAARRRRPGGGAGEVHRPRVSEHAAPVVVRAGRRRGPCRSPDSSDDPYFVAGALRRRARRRGRGAAVRIPRERVNRGTATNEELPGTAREPPNPALRIPVARRSGRTRRRRRGPVGFIIPVVGVPSAPVGIRAMPPPTASDEALSPTMTRAGSESPVRAEVTRHSAAGDSGAGPGRDRPAPVGADPSRTLHSGLSPGSGGHHGP